MFSVLAWENWLHRKTAAAGLNRMRSMANYRKPLG